jgi:zinc/manganese transport system substrate-binding protein
MRSLAFPAIGLLLAMTVGWAAMDGRLKVVAAENFYGDIAHQIGGDHVEVESILSNPDQDPHLFETTPTVVRQIEAAQIVVFNGAGYDPWITQLLRVTEQQGRAVISAAQLVNKKPGDNPHIWYDPATMLAVARALEEAFDKADPRHVGDYTSRLNAFNTSFARLTKKIEEIRDKYPGIIVTATEPVFGYMASALGLQMRNQGFQLAVMNNTEPSAHEIAAFEGDLKDHAAKVLIFNKQTSTTLTAHMLDIARESNIPVVGVTETEPMGTEYQDWMLAQLEDLQNALAHR